MEQTRKKILFRCDVSPEVGTGHLRRCLTLAKELKRHGAFIVFACRSIDFEVKYPDEIVDRWLSIDWDLPVELEVQQMIKIGTECKIDIVVLDRYRVNVEYQQQLYRGGIRWLQFDWSAQQPLWADWVLSPSPAADLNKYLSLKQRPETRLLIGPDYALIRDEFSQWQPKVQCRQQVERILLTFGGGDDRGATLFCLKALESLAASIERVVLVSSGNPNVVEIKNFLKGKQNVKLCLDEKEVARRMAEADLAIITGGTTAYETAAMGLPSLILQIADNQKPNSEALARRGVAINLGYIDRLHSTDIISKVQGLINDRQSRQSMYNLGKKLVDGLGSQRVAQILLSAKSTE